MQVKCGRVSSACSAWMRQFIQERNPINVIFEANASVTRKNVADHLRIHTAVKAYTCRECSKIYQLLDPQKTEPGGKLHKCVKCGKALILCSGLTQHQLIFFFFFFLQYCDGFCCISWTGHRRTYVSSLLNPSPLPLYPSRLSQSTCSYIRLPLALLHVVIYMSQC